MRLQMGNDELEDADPLLETLAGLGVLPPPQGSTEFRERLLRRTSMSVRARPRRRKWLVVCIMAVAYFAGIGTGLWLVIPAATSHRPDFLPDMAVSIAESGPQAPRTPTPRELLARVPGATPVEQVRLLTQAGDLYLSQWGDIQQALDCYRQVLELTPRSQPVSVEPADSWLLASLKLARMEETSHDIPKTST